MSLEQMYQNRRDQIIARAVDSLIRPNAAPNQIVADGQVQVAVAKKDEPELAGNGMDPALIVDVEESLGAYTWLISLVATKLSDLSINLDRLNEGVGRGYDLRRILFKFGKFGCKRNGLGGELKELKEIIEGFGDLDMIMDLLKLYQLFSSNPGIVQGLTKFDQTWIQDAYDLHTELYELRNEVKDPSAESEIAQLEQETKQAYDLYHEKVTELREWGEFVFEGERADKYVAEYYERRSDKAKITKKENAEKANSENESSES